MPAVTRLRDNNTGDDACPLVALARGSPNVFVNGEAVARVCDPVSLGEAVVQDSANVKV